MNNKIEGNFQPALEQRSGAWGFITHVRYRDADGRFEERHSRRVRKGLPGKPAWRKDWSILIDSLWMPEKLNWWIGVTFSLGSVLFALGSLLFLFPELAQAWSVDEAGANLTFFVGSIPFTMAAYMQFFQACNAETVLTESSGQDGYRWIAWRPGEAGWLSCAFQFAGTILFNINTFNALQPIAEWWQQDLEIWAPNITGSLLFFASGYLAWIENCHAHWSWQPEHISWWVCFINLIGCGAFLVSAVFGFYPPHELPFDAASISLWSTFAGAVAFLLGALLLLPETAAAEA